MPKQHPWGMTNSSLPVVLFLSVTSAGFVFFFRNIPHMKSWTFCAPASISWEFRNRFFLSGILFHPMHLKQQNIRFFMVFLHPCKMESLWCEAKKKSWPGWAVWRILIHQTSGKPPRFRSSPEVLETYTPSHEQFVSPQVTGANKPSPNQNSSCNSPNIWASNIHSFSPWIVRVFLERILQPYSRWGRQWSCDTHTRTTIAILTGLN